MTKLICIFFIMIFLSGCGRDFNISSKQAEEIVFQDAGINKADFCRTALSYEEGKEVYKISFVSGNENYFYTVDATSGAILRGKP